ncbi:hypothetical protein ACLB1M_08590 [Escherichia coli]
MPGYARHQADEQLKKTADALRLSGLRELCNILNLQLFCRPDKAFTPHPAFHNKHLSAI